MQLTSEKVTIEFGRRMIMKSDLAAAMTRLQPLSGDLTTAEQFEGSLSFLFSGWDADRREVWQISEVRNFFKELSHRWGYWVHFCERTGPTLPVLMSLLSTGHEVQIPATPGKVGWMINAEAIPITLSFLMDKQNQLCKKLGIGDRENLRVKREFTQAISAFLD